MRRVLWIAAGFNVGCAVWGRTGLWGAPVPLWVTAFTIIATACCVIGALSQDRKALEDDDG